MSKQRQFDYEEDFVALTVLCYLDCNAKKYLINPQKQSQMLNSSLLVYSVVIAMLGASLYGIFTNEEEEYNPYIPDTHMLWFIKFPCAIALHFTLTPQIQCGMEIMKFANQQWEQFVPNGSAISFMLGLIQVFTGVLCTFCNIVELAYQNNIQYCIVYFVALHVIMEVKNLYFESLKTNMLK